MVCPHYWRSLMAAFICVLTSKADNCIHDNLQPPRVPIQLVNYKAPSGDRGYINYTKFKRSVSDNYQKIRISTFYSDLDVELQTNETIKLKKIVDKAVIYINSLLSVVPVSGKLLLKRTGCLKEWSFGENSGKCAVLDRKYRGEFCQDNLKIPDNHLDGLYVWNKTGLEPVHKFYRPGVGVDTDFILFVRSLSTFSCVSKTKHSVLAYATFCKLDQNDRPIAGYINICPNAFKSVDVSTDKVYQTVIHELFHSLGFSKSLFYKFKNCTLSGSGLNCSPQISPLFHIVNEVKRLTTPAVLQKMKDHINCTTGNKYGGPIKFMNGEVTSHWDEKFMYGSIMTAKLDEPHLTFIDPITLAVLEDSGWYKVDYSKADQYFWGKGAGCLFGIPDICQDDSTFFCANNGDSGCHYLHKDKADCTYIDDLNDDCKIYKPSSQGECFLQTYNMLDDAELYTDSSRCFMSNLTKLDIKNQSDSLVGKCYDHRCITDQVLEVRVRGSSWHRCPYGTFISIPGFEGVLKCPDNKDILCPIIPVLTTEVPDITTTTPMIPGLSSRVNIVFKMNNISRQSDTISEERIVKSIRKKILNITSVPPDNVQNIVIDSERGVVSFYLHTTEDPVNDTIYQSLYNAVVNGNFTVTVEQHLTLTAQDILEWSQKKTAHHQLPTYIYTPLWRISP